METLRKRFTGRYKYFENFDSFGTLQESIILFLRPSSRGNLRNFDFLKTLLRLNSKLQSQNFGDIKIPSRTWIQKKYYRLSKIYKVSADNIFKVPKFLWYCESQYFSRGSKLHVLSKKSNINIFPRITHLSAHQ